MEGGESKQRRTLSGVVWKERTRKFNEFRHSDCVEVTCNGITFPYCYIVANYSFLVLVTRWAGYSDWLLAGRSGDRIPVKARFFTPVQTGPVAHPASCTMGTGPFPGGKERPGRDANPSPPSSAVSQERIELYLYSPYWLYGLYRASVSVQG
jgi:hypothetical protein